jgi:quercetin dioxygenase-like cupin family protein/DNA-binding XRE family transcriptional regulator
MARVRSDNLKRTAAAPAARSPAVADADSSALELRVGTRLRHARLLNHLRLKDVAEGAKCSESMLSKIENDRAVPSLTTLHRLCKTLNLSVSALLNQDLVAPCTILRRGERAVIGRASGSGSEGVKAEVLIPSADGRLLEGFVVIIEPGGHTAGVLQHKGEEVGYVIEGQLELTISDEVHLLNVGDSFYFPSDLPHAYRNPGRTPMRAIWINTPPTF